MEFELSDIFQIKLVAKNIVLDPRGPILCMRGLNPDINA